MMEREWLFPLPDLGMCLGISILCSLAPHRPPTTETITYEKAVVLLLEIVMT